MPGGARGRGFAHSGPARINTVPAVPLRRGGCADLAETWADGRRCDVAAAVPGQPRQRGPELPVRHQIAAGPPPHPPKRHPAAEVQSRAQAGADEHGRADGHGFAAGVPLVRRHDRRKPGADAGVGVGVARLPRHVRRGARACQAAGVVRVAPVARPACRFFQVADWAIEPRHVRREGPAAAPGRGGAHLTALARIGELGAVGEGEEAALGPTTG